MKNILGISLFILSIGCSTKTNLDSSLSKQKASNLKETQMTESFKDPFLWLEEVEGEKALKWVNKQNKLSSDELESDKRYKDFYNYSKEILEKKDRIPYGTIRGGYVYNFWRDDKNIRGIWRRTKIESYRKSEIEWETIIDFDQLAKDEKENWVYAGVECLAPDFNLCLLSLSRGGKDAKVIREFDIKSKSFIKDGFFIPEAKTGIEWFDKDHVIIGTDWGDGLTESGYPRIIKKLKRGQKLSEAETLIEGTKKDMGLWPWVIEREKKNSLMIIKRESFFRGENYWLMPDNSLATLPLQKSADVQAVFGDFLIFSLREEWSAGENKFSVGSLLAFSLSEFEKTKKLPKLHSIYVPTKESSLKSVSVSKNSIYLSLLENVKGKIQKADFDKKQGTWTRTDIDLPKTGSVSVISASKYDDEVFMGYEDYIKPDSLYEYKPEKNELTLLKSLPARFDASDIMVEQRFSTSKDGEKIPYFLIRRKDMEFNSKTPTLLYGYGGFQISLTPNYLSISGKLWIERGGAYAIANIRGGGEFGPAWHDAARKEKRQVAFNDFISVAEDLITQKVTSPEKLGIMGGSNGGLLVGAVMTQRPDLLNAVICSVPLLDMIRYTKLLAGASWVGEYGDPDNPEMRKVIEKYSPYHNIDTQKKYPKAFFITSTKDDRVHPGHARKMAAMMMKKGHPVYYYENTEGGHSAAANLLQYARRYALQYVYLSRQLELK